MGTGLKIVCISDTHTDHEKLDNRMPDGDVIIHSGDFTSSGNIKEYTDFVAWYSKLPYKYKIMCPGNHDFCCQQNHDICKLIANNKGIIYLSDDECEIEGVKFFGSPWTTFFCDWAFNAYEEELKEKFGAIPDNTAVLITHGPPYDILDKNEQGLRCGSKSLMSRLKELKSLKLVSFGHIHEGYGEYAISEGPLCVNVSMAGNRQHRWQKVDSRRTPFVFNI